MTLIGLANSALPWKKCAEGGRVFRAKSLLGYGPLDWQGLLSGHLGMALGLCLLERLPICVKWTLRQPPTRALYKPTLAFTMQPTTTGALLSD